MGFLFGNNSADIYKQNLPQQQQLWGMAQANANSEADLLNAQGDLAVKESEQAAVQKERETDTFTSEEAYGYLNSGVTLQGTPLRKIAVDTKKGQEEADALRAQGLAYQDLYRRKAEITKNEGRAAVLGSMSDYNIQQARAEYQDREAVRQPLFNMGVDIGKSLFSALLS